MSQIGQPDPRLNDIARRLYQALEIRANRDGRALNNMFQSIYPHRNWGPPHLVIQGYYYIPHPGLSVNTVQDTWSRFWNGRINVYANQVNLSLRADVDEIIGEAIEDRLRVVNRISNPRPYVHQAEAIIQALASLDQIRSELRQGRFPTGRPSPQIIALLAGTAGGKTEFFESIILQLVLDAKRVNRFDTVKAVIIYTMKAFMTEHFRRFLRDILYINDAIQRGRVHGVSRPLTIGVLCGDTPRRVRNRENVEVTLRRLLNSLSCPLCGQQIIVRQLGRMRGPGRQVINFEIYCSNHTRRHNLGVIRICREDIYEMPPDILLITPDMLNLIITNRSTMQRLFVQHGGFPLILVLDEPHAYTGIFGTNVSMLIRELKTLFSILLLDITLMTLGL